MNDVLSEKDYQNHFLEKLQKQGYQVRDAGNCNRHRAMDTDLLFDFLWKTQPDEMEKLQKIYKDDLQLTLLNLIQKAEEDPSKGRLYLLKNGLDVNSMHLTFLFTKPATDFNKKLVEQYESNIFSVAEEVWASETERIDLVTFINGFAVTAFELKCNPAGQSYKHAIHQFRKNRSPKTRLFKWNAGVLVCFAMDLHEVYMTTRLQNGKTTFLPFNKGTGTGTHAGAGNPVPDGEDFAVSYMWEDILSKDTMLEIISKFMFRETGSVTDTKTGKAKKTEAVIFPRYHQLDAVRKLVADVAEFRTEKNYLIQHSAGSGKTNTLAWLAHRFASLHDADNKQVFDTIIICTDRVVVDRQLQTAIRRLDHKEGLIRVMDDDCTSADLADALQSNTKIIATTIQKFPYIADEVKNLKDRTFAVIIDEAHSSTAGKNMQKLEQTLSAGEEDDLTMEDIIDAEIKRSGKQPNVSMFAFTATPKPVTLEMFGQIAPSGNKEPFHIYSMQQAIEEGFILDVLQNYTTYKTFVELNKSIEDDPQYETSKAKAKIAQFIDLNDTNIQQRVEIIIEHFRASVQAGLGGTAKAMIVTKSRQAAVKFQKAIQAYIAHKGYDDVHSLVAFSGKVKLDDGTEYSEPQMNGFAEKVLPSEFDKNENNILVVANKYQTGFDQKRLSAMYVLKKLDGINAVQTLSRLNRVMPSGQKQTFVLDFVNDYSTIREAFEKYYTVTFLSNSVTPTDISELMAKLDEYGILVPSEVEQYNELLYLGKDDAHKAQKMDKLLSGAMDRVHAITKSDGEEAGQQIRRTIRSFIRFYEFLLLATSYKDEVTHKNYNFLKSLQAMMKADDAGDGFSLKDQIEVVQVQQEKQETHEKSQLQPDPELKLPKADQAYATKDNLQRLSEIIREINERNGSHFDVDSSLKAILQVKDKLTQSDALQRSAKTNSFEDFEKYVVEKQLDDALTDVLEENYTFYKTLLGDKEHKAQIMRIFTPELFRQMQASV